MLRVRFCGDGIRARFGDIPLILGSLLLATAGFVLIGLSHDFMLSTVAFALTGFGTACVIPAIFAITAKHMAENRARALGIVSLVAGLPRVLAPWFFGWIATLHSTSFAFGLCAVAMAVALGLHPAAAGAAAKSRAAGPTSDSLIRQLPAAACGKIWPTGIGRPRK